MWILGETNFLLNERRRKRLQTPLCNPRAGPRGAGPHGHLFPEPAGSAPAELQGQPAATANDKREEGSFGAETQSTMAKPGRETKI